MSIENTTETSPDDCTCNAQSWSVGHHPGCPLAKKETAMDDFPKAQDMRKRTLDLDNKMVQSLLKAIRSEIEKAAAVGKLEATYFFDARTGSVYTKETRKAVATMLEHHGYSVTLSNCSSYPNRDDDPSLKVRW